VSRHSPWATAEGAVCKQARERRLLRDQAGCGLEHSSSRMSVLAFKVRFCKFTFGEDLKIFINFHNALFFNEISCALSKAFETMRFNLSADFALKD
jgi:hypothetical protein